MCKKAFSGAAIITLCMAILAAIGLYKQKSNMKDLFDEDLFDPDNL